MKTLTSLLFFLFLSINLSLAQQFAPVGATWHFTQRSGSVLSLNSFVKLHVEKDTLFQGINCRLIKKSKILSCHGRRPQEIVYESNDTVYFWDADLQQFQSFIVFGSNPGDWWEFQYKWMSGSETIRVTVDSISTEIFNGQPLRVMHVTYQQPWSMRTITYDSQIVERFGDVRYLFNYMPNINCDATFSGGLRCYADSAFGSYISPLSPGCEYNNIATQDIEWHQSVSIHPNPVQTSFEVGWAGEEPIHLKLVNAAGLAVIDIKLRKKNSKVDVSQLSPGVYIALLSNGKEAVYRKVTIKDGE